MSAVWMSKGRTLVHSRCGTVSIHRCESKIMRVLQLIAFCLCMAMLPTVLIAEDASLVGYWPLRGDCLDHSGHGLNGINHGVKLESSEFDGRSAYIEIPNAAALAFAGGDFSIAAEIYTEKGLDDCLGDIVSKFAATDRRGFNLTLVSNTSGYNSQSDAAPTVFWFG